jgi:Spy/CpxP family protein refolding chaperone
MSSNVTSAMLLGATLLIGAAVGAFGAGAIAQRTRGGPPPGGGRGGFVEQMTRLVEPTDEAQREAMVPIFEAQDERNRSVIESAEEEMRAGLQEMAQQLEGILNSDQQARLERSIRRSRPLSPGPGRRGGPPPGGGPPRGGPPPGGPRG